MALTKADMAEQLFEVLGLNKREAKELVEQFFEEIRSSLERGQQVKLSGFGNFDLREKRERPGRNPKTGEEIPITARRVVTFRPGQKRVFGPNARMRESIFGARGCARGWRGCRRRGVPLESAVDRPPNLGRHVAAIRRLCGRPDPALAGALP